MIDNLMWVSEWRIEDSTDSEKMYDWHFRVTDGGVYTNTKTYDEARKEVHKRIRQEKEYYKINNIQCPKCKKCLGDHDGQDWRFCLTNLAIQSNNDMFIT